jgi:hypothetical protein
LTSLALDTDFNANTGSIHVSSGTIIYLKYDFFFLNKKKLSSTFKTKQWISCAWSYIFEIVFVTCTNPAAYSPDHL